MELRGRAVEVDPQELHVAQPGAHREIGCGEQPAAQPLEPPARGVDAEPVAGHALEGAGHVKAVVAALDGAAPAREPPAQAAPAPLLPFLERVARDLVAPLPAPVAHPAEQRERAAAAVHLDRERVDSPRLRRVHREDRDLGGREVVHLEAQVRDRVLFSRKEHARGREVVHVQVYVGERRRPGDAGAQHERKDERR